MIETTASISGLSKISPSSVVACSNPSLRPLVTAESPPAVHSVGQAQAAAVAEGRQQDEAGEVPRAQHADGRPVAVLATRDSRMARRSVCSCGRGYSSNTPRYGSRPAFDQLVGARGLFDGKAMRNERPQVELAASHQFQNGLDVPLLGPADVGRRIIVAAVLIFGIVPARPVRAGDDELGLLEVERPTIELEADDADEDDPPFFSHGGRGQVDRAVGRSRSRDEHASAPSPPVSDSISAPARPGRAISAPMRRASSHLPASGSVPITRQPEAADNPTAICPIKPRPIDEDRFAQLRAGEPHAVERNGAQHGESGLIEVDILRDGRAQMLADADDLRMRPIGGDAVARFEVLHVPARRRAPRRPSCIPLPTEHRAVPAPAEIVVSTPSLRHFSITRRTRSGRSRALPNSDFLASSITIRSVPAEMTEATLAISTSPGCAKGAGTSATPNFPLRIS